MAQKRMFSLKIVDSDAFIDMSQTAQLLYFHLAMRTDDDGFVDNPKKIMRMIGSGGDDFKILIAKKFIIGFDSGVIVIKHHRINNNWDKYNCKRTQYLEEFETLNIKENGSYTIDKQQGLPVQTESRLKTVLEQSLEENRIEENRIDKISNTHTKFKKPTQEEIKSYCLERGNKVDHNRFYDFYESKGWKVGKNQMKDWKASVRTWEKGDVKPSPKNVLHTGENIISKIKLKN